MSTETDLDLDLDEGSEEETEETGTEKEPTVEELKTSVSNLEKALKKANREAARLRNEKKATDEGKKPEAEEKAAAPDRYKRSAVAAAARAELKDAGFSGTKEQAAKLSRLLDLDELDVDEDGEIDGLEDAVLDLKEQFPALFSSAVENGKPKTPKVDAGTKPSPQGSIKTSVDKVAEERYNRLFGGGGRRR